MPIRSNVFRKYIFSYLSVALAICLTLGIALNLASTHQLSKTERDISLNRLAQAADDVERQIEAMQDVRIDIKTNVTFHPSRLHQDVTKSIELINTFSRYSSYSSWMNEYYLWYRNDARIFSPHSAYSEPVFFRYIMNGLDAEALAQNVTGEDVFFQVTGNRPDSLMICLPFYFGTAAMRTEECVLIVMVPMNDLRSAVWSTTGSARGSSFGLQYAGENVIHASENAVLSAISAQGKVELFMDPDDLSSVNRVEDLQRMTVGIVVAVLLMSVALATWLGWRNYQPIKRLYRKYVGTDAGSENEWTSIENLLSSTMQVNALSKRELESQMAQLARQQNWLKQQTLMLLLAGSEISTVQKHMQILGFTTPHRWYAMMFLYIADGEAEGVLKDVEDLSDDEWSLYGTELEDGHEYIVLVNFDDEEQYDDIPRLLTDALVTHGLAAYLRLSRAVSSLSDLAAVSMEALGTQALPLSDQTEQIADADGFERLDAFIAAGDAVGAQKVLNDIISNFKRRYPSYLMRIYMFGNLRQRLVDRALQEGLELPVKSLQTECDSMEEMQYLSELVVLLCNHGTVPEKEGTRLVNDRNEAVVYCREHCLEGSISLSSVAEALGISTKQVSRLLRTGVGMTFKEYVLQLRMDAAREIMLCEDLTIAETAERVGYFNTSHFIKCFKTYTGLTPGEWKKLSRHWNA